MGYQVLIETLLKEGVSKSREIMEKARAESEAILREAKEKAGRLEQESREEVEKELQARRTRILNRARIEARGILLKAKQEILDRVFEKAQDRLRERFRQTQQGLYLRLITRWVEESLPEGQATGLKAILHEDAPEVLEKVLRERGVVCQRVKDPGLWLGFKLISSESRLAVTNSYAARLEKIRPDLLVELNALLFSERGQRSAGSKG